MPAITGIGTNGCSTAAIGPTRILEIGNAFRSAKVLLSAVELGVFTALARGPHDLDALTAEVGIAGRGARDFFDHDERRRGLGGLLASLHMLVMTEGGFDFTAAECVSWMLEAGFHHPNVESLTSTHSMVAAVK